MGGGCQTRGATGKLADKRVFKEQPVPPTEMATLALTSPSTGTWRLGGWRESAVLSHPSLGVIAALPEHLQ